MRGRPNSARAALFGASCLAARRGAPAAGDGRRRPAHAEAGPTENAAETDTLYKIVLFIGLAVIGLVWADLSTRFSASGRAAAARRPDHAATPPRARMDHRAAAIVIAITIITYIFLADISIRWPPGRRRSRRRGASSPPSTSHRRPTRRARDPGLRTAVPVALPVPTAVSFQEMVVPRDNTVMLTIKANDVVHSWWIPELAGKSKPSPTRERDLVQGHRERRLQGQCAELCGDNYA